jgi:GNAT superfamily N-acetyltransferase
MSAPPVVRPAVPADVFALAGLRLGFRCEVEPPSEPEPAFLERCAAWMARRLVPGGAWQAWVADTAGGLVGTAWLHLIGKLPNPVAEPEWHGYVSSLYVVPERRGSGLGSVLLAACLEECRRRAVDAVVLWPTPRSRALYLRHGFAVRDDLLELRG